jgi:hypothetical protein
MQQLEEILGREIADIIKSQIDPWRIQVIALEKRIAEMEALKPEKGERGDPGKDGAPGRDGKDGIGISSTVIDRGGNLIITKTDGAIHNAGIVVGTDGKDGAPGQTGKDGAPGRDGFGFDDLEAMDEPLRFGWRFIRGGDAKEFWWNKATLADFDHELYREGNVYPRGAVISSEGSLWICKAETKQRPGVGKSWRLAVKRGKDGKDGERGPMGPQGKAGKDATIY